MEAKLDPPEPALKPSLGAWLGALLMALLVLITLANVLARYFTNHSFAWTEEISVFLMVVLTLVGSARIARHDSHIRVEFFYLRGSPRRQRALALVSGLCTALLFLLLTALLVRTGLSEYAFEETTTGLGVPRWWYTASLPMFALAVALAALWRLARGERHAPRVDDEEGPAP